ncbi:hypothetical protein SMUL_1767 [Sulfurospirillum multivorans DSM 12446]|uniref:Uncharacterized protein n=2 Tax=Sulfurospirillum multivorans TaxID=66821 RepID=A0AA86ANJ4_SULMK|nr:hypothetical protein SMUL_1767 [Sulfurospirillum multivorans DSM 12446]
MVTHDHDVKFQLHDKTVLEGHMGSGKTVQLEKIALKLHAEGTAFVLITTFHDAGTFLENPMRRPLQSSRDFEAMFIENKCDDALIVQSYCEEVSEKVLEQIEVILDKGAVLMIDETSYVLENEAIRTIFHTTLKKDHQGVIITCQSIDDLERYLENENKGIL